MGVSSGTETLNPPTFVITAGAGTHVRPVFNFEQPERPVRRLQLVALGILRGDYCQIKKRKIICKHQVTADSAEVLQEFALTTALGFLLGVGGAGFDHVLG